MTSQSDRLCKKLKLIDTCDNSIQIPNRFMVVASWKDIKSTYYSKIGHNLLMSESLGNKENRTCSHAGLSYPNNSLLCLRMP